MKTIQHLEAEDIDLKNPIHGWLWATVIVAMLTYKKVEDGSDADPLDFFRKTIAGALNSATEQGIVITKE